MRLIYLLFILLLFPLLACGNPLSQVEAELQITNPRPPPRWRHHRPHRPPRSLPPSAKPPANQPHLGYGVQLAEAKNMALAVQGGFTWAKHDLNIRKETNFLTNADNLLSDLRKSNTENVLLKLVVWTEALMLNTSAW